MVGGRALRRYRGVLAVRDVRRLLVLGVLARTPMFATGFVLTLHVVSELGRGYAAAGLVSAALTVAIAVSGPWRGRLLDRFGLRRTVAPSLLVWSLCWSVAPFAAYPVLLVLAVAAGLFAVPSFVVVRQGLIAAVDESERRAVISVDSAMTEVAFMAGPLAAVWAATTWPTPWVLFTVAMLQVVGGALIWLADPPLHRPAEAVEQTAPVADVRPDLVDDRADPAAPSSGPGLWSTPAFWAVLLAALVCTVVLSATDLGIVATMREQGRTAAIGVVVAAWGFGSLLGGLVYGALTRAISAFWLLAGLGLVTMPMALARGPVSLAALALVAGLLCAPTITATIDQLSRAVPERRLGEAMGWHGSALTGGLAVGAPLAGAVTDRAGHEVAFAGVGAIGLLVGVGCAGLAARYAARPSGATMAA